MPNPHKINDLYSISGLNMELRCTCGALLITNSGGRTPIPTITEAFDKHMIGILETQWVQQFYPQA